MVRAELILVKIEVLFMAYFYRVGLEGGGVISDLYWTRYCTVNSGGSRIFQMGGRCFVANGGRTSCFQVKSA